MLTIVQQTPDDPRVRPVIAIAVSLGLGLVAMLVSVSITLLAALCGVAETSNPCAGLTAFRAGGVAATLVLLAATTYGVTRGRVWPVPYAIVLATLVWPAVTNVWRLVA